MSSWAHRTGFRVVLRKMVNFAKEPVLTTLVILISALSRWVSELAFIDDIEQRRRLKPDRE
jgi:hypothetical protein